MQPYPFVTAETAPGVGGSESVVVHGGAGMMTPLSRNLLADIPRSRLDQMLFEAMAAIYHFERRKVQLFGINYEAFYLLYFLRRRSSAGMGEIADEMNIHLSTASRTVERLEKRGLVIRRKASHDKRQILVSLEPAGEELVRASEDHSFGIIARNVEGFQEEDVAALVKTAALIEKVLRIPVLQEDRGGLRLQRPAAGKDSVI
ncbi:MAG: MarR family winged helix-turn-helix transcriptional regulator [Thermodesulfobacteriota bacterium]